MLVKMVKRLWIGLRYLALWALLLVALRDSVYPLNTAWGQIGLLTSDQHFDFIGWELSALAAKASQALWGAHPFMDEASRSAYVRAYFDDMAQAHALEAQIESVYADPTITDPDTASADLRAERDALRADLASRQSLAEAILEGQVAAVLIDEGFGVNGQLVPPIAMRLTPLPNLLVISPRDQIVFQQGINLYALTTEERQALEQRLYDDLDMAALVVPLGGIALYPAMVLESSDLRWTAETFAHEWLHHYFFMYPLGWALDFSDPTWHINETAASLFGVEVGRKVMARYYGEPLTETHLTPQTIVQETAPPFDFGAAMHETRVTVDALLADGRVDEAEAYMEERRALFFANGYAIRKLNQAYFAFYGGYQVDGIPGIAGEDPVGPAIRAIRDASPDLHAFAVAVRGLTTREALLAAAAGL